MRPWDPVWLRFCTHAVALINTAEYLSDGQNATEDETSAMMSCRKYWEGGSCLWATSRERPLASQKWTLVWQCKVHSARTEEDFAATKSAFSVNEACNEELFNLYSWLQFEHFFCLFHSLSVCLRERFIRAVAGSYCLLKCLFSHKFEHSLVENISQTVCLCRHFIESCSISPTLNKILSKLWLKLHQSVYKRSCIQSCVKILKAIEDIVLSPQ